MALIKCKECGSEVSSKAASCPKCGASVPSKPAGSVKLILVIILAIAIIPILILSGFSGAKTATPPAAAAVPDSAEATSTVAAEAAAAKIVAELAAPPPPTVAEVPPAPIPGLQWRYHHVEDKMGTRASHQAEVSSTNMVNFNFPYSGAQYGTLTLRTHPRYGKDVIFRIEKGQILCHSYEDCTVLVRFDDEKPTTYAAVGPEDNSTEMIFLRNYSRFAAKLLKAKRVRISVNIYQEGAPVFEFDVSGFNTSEYIPKT